MNKTLSTMVMATAVAVAVGIVRADTKTTYRDAQGRVQGTVTTDRYGKTTYRDAQGRVHIPLLSIALCRVRRSRRRNLTKFPTSVAQCLNRRDRQ